MAESWGGGGEAEEEGGGGGVWSFFVSKPANSPYTLT